MKLSNSLYMGQELQDGQFLITHSQRQMVPYIVENLCPCSIFWCVLGMLLLKSREKKIAILPRNGPSIACLFVKCLAHYAFKKAPGPGCS